MQEIIEQLNRLRPSGLDGFEGLILQLLQRLTGYRFHLARAGSQSGRDLGGRLKESFVAIECKRYGDTRPFDDHQLLGSMEQSARHARDLGLWILASTRDVPDQLVQELDACAARLGIDFAVLSAHGQDHSELLTLCAAFPDTALKFFAGTDQERSLAARELAEIQSTVGFAAAFDRMRATLSPAQWGYERWRVAQNEWTASRFTNEAASRAAFSQPLDVVSGRESLIPRVAAETRLNDWWSQWATRNSKLALLGQEGDGKSWAVASWLASQLGTDAGFPPVVFVASTVAGEREPLELIADIVRNQLNATAPDWPRRFQRWLSGRPTPVLLLVLDGINEGSRPPEYWIQLLQRLGEPELASKIAVLLTCRPAAWYSSFGQLRHLEFEEWVLEPLTKQELEPALMSAGLQRDVVVPAMFDLMRKPRYLQLAIKHHKRLNETGDFTIARLIYEDWRERWWRKSTLADPNAFDQMIKDLARRHRDQQTHVSLQEVESSLPSWSNPSATTRELVETGILKPQGGRFVVDRQQLGLGLGLLLADDLNARSAQGEIPDEVIASWLEPHSDIDIKAEITEFAALSALQADDYPERLCTALLHSWLGNRNRELQSQARFAGYFLLNPNAYAALVECVWRQDEDARAIQDALMATFLRWSGSQTALSNYQRIFERWLGFVHADGCLSNAPEDTKQRQRDRFANSAADAESRRGSQLVLAGRTLTQVDDPALLRLGRFALAVISCVDRRLFCDCLLTATVGDALMVWSGRDDLFAWVVRSGLDSELVNRFENSIRELISLNTVTAHRAAADLIRVLGTEAALELRALLRSDLYERSSISDSRDPCTAWRRWTVQDCVTCAERSDIPAHYIAKQLEKRCTDPEFTPSPTAVRRVREFARELNMKAIAASTGHTIDDHHLSQVEPILCRGDIEALRALIDQAIGPGFARSGLPLRQFILHFFRENSLLMTDAHWERAEACWRVLRALPEDDLEGTRAEWFLFGLLLSRWPALTQLERLLERRTGDRCLTDWRRQFRPMEDWRNIPALLSSLKDVERLQRLIWFIGTHPDAIPPEMTSTLARLLTHEDSFLRSLVMQVLAQSGHAQSFVDAFASSSWAWSPARHVDENHWGSILLVRAVHLTYHEVRRRVWPAYLGLAVDHRGLRREDIEAYGEDLDQVWTALPSIAPALPTRLPQMRLSIEDDSVLAPRPLVGIGPEEFSRTVHYRNSDSFWGGTLEDEDAEGAAAAESPFKAVSDEAIQRRQSMMGNALRQQWEVGNTWFGQRFPPDALPDVLRARPEMLEKWTRPLLQPGRASSPYARLAPSFYEALARAAFEVNPQRALELLRYLESSGEIIIAVWEGTEHRVLDSSLFKCQWSPALETVWVERLRACRTDAELFSIVLAAETGCAEGWLADTIRRMLGANRLLDHAIGLTLAGFSTTPEAGELLKRSEQQLPSGWIRTVATKAHSRWRSNQWARHWYRQFSTEPSDAAAWAAFRLFLREVDSRFWWWEDRGALDEKRNAFVEDNEDVIARAVKHNEKDLKESLAGQKVLERECAPWMRDYEL